MPVEALKPSLPRLMVEDAVRAALLEDLGHDGDITTNATIVPDATAAAASPAAWSSMDQTISAPGYLSSSGATTASTSSRTSKAPPARPTVYVAAEPAGSAVVAGGPPTPCARHS